MLDVGVILKRLEEMLLSLGFNETSIGGNRNFVLGSTYCIPQHIIPLGFFMEYAHSEEEAAKNWHGDGRKFSPLLGEANIIEGIRTEVITNTPELRQSNNTPLAQAV